MKTFIALIVSCFLVLVSVLPAYAQKVLPTSAGKSQLKNYPLAKDGFAIGDIKLAWKKFDLSPDISSRYALKKFDFRDCVVIFIRNFRSAGGKYIPNGLKFAIVYKGKISDVEDPSTLNYQDEISAYRGYEAWRNIPVPRTVYTPAKYLKPGETVKGLNSADAEKYKVVAGILINYNEILFLQLGNKYAAIKPTHAEQNYLPWDQTTNAEKARLAAQLQRRIEQTAKSGSTAVETPRVPTSQTMDCEWAYWKFIPSRPPISKKLIVKSASQSQAK